jgi:hypothetical protein
VKIMPESMAPSAERLHVLGIGVLGIAVDVMRFKVFMSSLSTRSRLGFASCESSVNGLRQNFNGSLFTISPSSLMLYHLMSPCQRLF